MVTTTATPRIQEVAPGVLQVVEHAASALLEEVIEALGRLDGDPQLDVHANDIARVDLLDLLERLKGAAAGAQARITNAFADSQLELQQEAADAEAARGNDVRADRLRRNLGKGIGDQVALARRSPTSQGAKHLRFARAMQQMPHTLALLSSGQISEWTATILVQETSFLSETDRGAADEHLCATTVDTKTGEICPARVLAMTPKRAGDAARALASSLDPEAAVRRAAKAVTQRRVTIRPTPTTMTYVTGLLPVKDGVAVHASLRAAAKSAKAQGDDRTVSQLMADLLVQRVTGHPAQGDGAGEDTNDAGNDVAESKVPIHVNLVMGAATFTGDSDQSARTDDGMPIPAGMARDWVHDPATPVTIRRIFTDPVTGQVTEVDTRQRRHSAGDKRFFRIRDQVCRMPGCDRPIDDIDHPERHADGGATSRANGQGTCEGHNQAKEAPGWRTRVTDPRPGHHEVEFTTPTGHTYRSQAPPALPPDAERADLPPPASESPGQ